jgi:2-dehydropantoate 2-reductase
VTVTIYGAGAIGGTIGAHLVRNGIPVRLVDRDGNHVAAMNERGLTIQNGPDTFTVPVDAVTPDDLTGPLDLVMLAVKAQHTDDAMRVIAPLLTPTSTVVSLQNGLCERTIAARIGKERTVGCLVNFSADYIEPGLILYGGAGAIELGELNGAHTDRLDRIHDLLALAGEVKVTDNIWGYIWGKMGYANMLFATALTDETMGDIIDRYRPLMVELASEIYEVADREGVTPEPFDDVEPALYYPRERRDWDVINRSLDALVARRHRAVKTHSGIWRDLAVRNRPTEVDSQIGLAAEVGASHGLPMPLTRALVATIHDLEANRRTRGLHNIDELNARLDPSPPTPSPTAVGEGTYPDDIHS